MAGLKSLRLEETGLDGAPLLDCELPKLGLAYSDEALIHAPIVLGNLLVLSNLGPGGGTNASVVRAFQVPGLQPASSGWTGALGNMARSRQPLP